MSYFSVAVMKYHNYKQPIEGGGYAELKGEGESIMAWRRHGKRLLEPEAERAQLQPQKQAERVT